MKAVMLLVLIVLQLGFSSWGQSWFYYCAEDAPLTEDFLAICDSSRGTYRFGLDVTETNIEIVLNGRGRLAFIYGVDTVESPIDSLPAKEVTSQDLWGHSLTSFKKGVYFTLTYSKDSIQELMVVKDSILAIFGYDGYHHYTKAKGLGWVYDESWSSSITSRKDVISYNKELKVYERWYSVDSTFESYTRSKQTPRMKTSGVAEHYKIFDFFSDSISEYKQEEIRRSDGSLQIRELDCSDKYCRVTSTDVTPEGDTTWGIQTLSRNKGVFVPRFDKQDTLVTKCRLSTDEESEEATFTMVPDKDLRVYWRDTPSDVYKDYYYRPLTVLTKVEGKEVYGTCQVCTKDKCGMGKWGYGTEYMAICTYSDKSRKVWGSFLISRSFAREESAYIWKHGKTSEGTFLNGERVGF